MSSCEVNFYGCMDIFIIFTVGSVNCSDGAKGKGKDTSVDTTVVSSDED